MNIIMNFVCKGKHFMLPDESTIDINFDHIYKPNSLSILPSGIERKMNYGYADISKKISAKEVDETLNSYLDLFKKNRNKLINYGLEDIALYLTFGYKTQFNWEFDPLLLGKISDIGIVLAISAYELD